MSEYELSTAELSGPGLDITVPNVARIYDFFLGGKDNFEADRRAAAELTKLIPDSALACRQNRSFLGCVVEYLARAGIRQFLDIGCGLPTAGNVHEIAQAVAPDARIVYVDYDPVVVLHSQVLLEKKPKGVAVAAADLRNPQSITDDPRVQEMIDFSEPVAVLLLAVMHFIGDAERPDEIAGHFKDVMAPGSYLALSHITDEDVQPEHSLAARRVYQRASAPVVPRSRSRIMQFFDGLQIISPGVVDIGSWPGHSPRITPATRRLFYGGVAVKERMEAREISCSAPARPAFGSFGALGPCSGFGMSAGPGSRLTTGNADLTRDRAGSAALRAADRYRLSRYAGDSLYIPGLPAIAVYCLPGIRSCELKKTPHGSDWKDCS